MIRGYISKPKGVRKKNSLGNTAIEHTFKLVLLSQSVSSRLDTREN